MKKTAVFGVGAIGGSLAGFMALEGQDVTFIDSWPDHVKAMNDNGLVLDGTVGEHRVEVKAIHTDDVDKLDTKFDILLVAVKSYDTEWATRLMLPHLKDDAWVVSPQNGINEYLIAPIVGASRTIGCITIISAAMNEAGRITRTDSAAASGQKRPVYFRVGEMDGTITPRAEELARLFEPAGHTVVTDNLWGERWTKLAINCMANGMGAITGLTSYDIRATESSRKIMLRLCEETVTVGRTLGHKVKVPVGDFSLEDLRRAVKGENPELEEAFAGKPTENPGRPSMAQDTVKGRRTEIDYLNGFTVKQGNTVGVPTPYNQAMITVVKGVESGELEVGMENVARVERAAAAGVAAG